MIVIIINILLIIIAVLLFGFMIFIHEFGHFFTAKLSGVRVNEFAIGMGPTIFKFQRQDTKYSIRLLPIGGFCSMEGEDEESPRDDAFNNKPVWKRMIIVVAGVIMNILFGIILSVIILCQQNAFPSTVISGFADNAISNQNGLQVGDKILSINGYKIYTDKDLSFALATDKDFSLDMVVERNGEIVNLNDVKFGSVEASNGSKVLQLDFTVKPIKKTFASVITQSLKSTISNVRIVWSSLIGIIMGRFSLNELAGPIGTASVISEVAGAGLQYGFVYAVNNILNIMALITINLGIFNLLPLPALDGGRLLFLIIEAIRRKPINPKYEGIIHMIGFIVLLAFMIFISLNDVFRLFNGKGFGI